MNKYKNWLREITQDFKDHIEPLKKKFFGGIPNTLTCENQYVGLWEFTNLNASILNPFKWSIDDKDFFGAYFVLINNDERCIVNLEPGNLQLFKHH